jgi:hypothetical protein
MVDSIAASVEDLAGVEGGTEPGGIEEGVKGEKESRSNSRKEAFLCRKNYR